MVRLSGSRFNILVCLASVLLGAVNAQDPFSDVLTSNTQLWKSFQEEMKTLEQAAHRVNTLLTNAANQSKSQDDQEAKPAENPLDVTVLASADKLKDGVLTQPDHSSTAESDKQKDNNNQGGVKQPSNPHNLNLRSFINSIGIFGYMPEPEPWWKGKNVCLETSEKVENKLNGEKEVDKHLIVMGTGTFEHCKQTSGKYICTTVISTPQFTKTLSRTYQCCEGFRREKNQCVQGEHPTSLAFTEGPEDSSSKGDHSVPEFLPHKDAVPQNPQYNSISVGKSVEDKSFSSQSDEANGRPAWLKNYLRHGWMKK